MCKNFLVSIADTLTRFFWLCLKPHCMMMLMEITMMIFMMMIMLSHLWMMILWGWVGIAQFRTFPAIFALVFLFVLFSDDYDIVWLGWYCAVWNIPSQCPAGRVFQYRVGSGRVLNKIPGSGSGSGRVRVSKNTIGYFRVSFFLSGISGYFGYFRVFQGLPIYTRVIF